MATKFLAGASVSAMICAGLSSTPGHATPIAQTTYPPLIISSPGNNLVGPFPAGSVVTVTGTLYSPAPDIDPGESGENEPLVVQVLNGNQVFTTLLTDPTYGQPIPQITYNVTQNGQMLNAFIRGMDIGPKGLAFDEQANLTIAVNPNPNAPKLPAGPTAGQAAGGVTVLGGALTLLGTLGAIVTKNPALAANLNKLEAVTTILGVV